MRKVALVFVLAVFVPSLALAWLAVRSLRDQQYAIEHQRSLLYHGVADSLAKEIQHRLQEHQQAFKQEVDGLLAVTTPQEIAAKFDDRLRRVWPLAEVGFAVALAGQTNHVLSPSPLGNTEARRFRLENDRFLCSRETVEVYWNSPKGPVNLAKFEAIEAQNPAKFEGKEAAPPLDKAVALPGKGDPETSGKAVFATKGGKLPRPESNSNPDPPPPSPSNAISEETQFRNLIGDATEGTLARFLQDQLKVLFWYRPAVEPQLVFGAQLGLDRLVKDLGRLIGVDDTLGQDICVALISDDGRPEALSRPGFQTDWRRPFVAAELGELLPHWQVAVYLLDPSRLGHAARTLRLTLGLLIAVLLLAIGIGSWLIVTDLKRQLEQARQKTDFVSNVSHELKTPLTSIRMFSELLAEGRVPDEARRRQFLHIVSAEAARLARLINNVLDFARLERGEKKYQFKHCDLRLLLQETVEAYRPHLETSGFAFDCTMAREPMLVRADPDAVAQIIVNLLSNAEKYSGDRKEITVECDAPERTTVELRVLDRGLGVPTGCEERVFEQFYRAHDSLASGVQGSGLGLTLARQMARAHRGDVTYRPRPAGGSCFTLRLPCIHPIEA